MTIIDAQILTFVAVVVALTITPGSTTMLITRSVIVHGQKAGFIVLFGGCMGVFVHATLSGLGLSLILVQSAKLFNTIKLLGAIYIILLGGHSIWRAMRQKPKGLFSLNPRTLTSENKTE